MGDETKPRGVAAVGGAMGGERQECEGVRAADRGGSRNVEPMAARAQERGRRGHRAGTGEDRRGAVGARTRGGSVRGRARGRAERGCARAFRRRRTGAPTARAGDGAMIPTGVRSFVCTAPVDMRYGFDRLAQLARERVGQDPVDGGALFVFAGKGATRLKVLWFDRNGLCLLYKRLHRAVFELPAAANGAVSVHIDG